MRLEDTAAWKRLTGSRHGVLATLHPVRGVDQVPVVFASRPSTLFIPVDTVKAKTGRRLQRLVNLAVDPRCSLLVERWSENWEELWWVRATGTGVVVDADVAREWHGALADRYPQYRDPSTIAGGISITVTGTSGWAASRN